MTLATDQGTVKLAATPNSLALLSERCLGKTLIAPVHLPAIDYCCPRPLHRISGAGPVKPESPGICQDEPLGHKQQTRKKIRIRLEQSKEQQHPVSIARSVVTGVERRGVVLQIGDEWVLIAPFVMVATSMAIWPSGST